MKLSDYVMDFLAGRGLRHMFLLPGGGCMHLVDSVGRNEHIEYVPCLHEQAASIAAESYAQHTNDLGAVLVTTGPGGTNAMTGLAAAWIDSTPVFFLSGQVKRSDRIGESGVRQMGSQEVDIVPIVRHLTKYAVTVMEPTRIRYEMEKAYHLALHGRRGPVWLDIPLDVQAAEIDAASLDGYVPEEKEPTVDQADAQGICTLLRNARRPLILAGNGVKLAGAEEDLRAFMKKTGIPVLLTWKAIDMLDGEDEQYFGCPGVMGHRYANFILQNADCLLVLGSRLDSSLTAWNHEHFAPQAKKIMVDIDETEIRKMKMELAVSVVADAGDFLQALNDADCNIDRKQIEPWISYCRDMRRKYPAVTQDMQSQKEYVNAHAFVAELSKQLTSEDVIVPESSGGAGEITCQAFRVKYGQKVKHAAGLGSMGFGIPYAIGACIANGRKRTVLINGDGAFQLNIQELATIAGQNLPIKIFVWENGGYASIQGTQRNYFEGNYVAASKESRLFLPNLGKVAAAYGLQVFRMQKPEEMKETIAKVLRADGPVLCEVSVSPEETASPRVKARKLPDGNMVSGVLEDMWPYLDEAEMRENTWG